MTPERLAEITNREKQGASFYERWPVAAYEDVRDLLADNASLRSELARVKEAAEVLAKSVSGVRGTAGWPELTSTMRQGLGCGIEDRNINDRYEAAEYGYEDALERCHEFIKNATSDVDANPTAAALVEQARKEMA